MTRIGLLGLAMILISVLSADEVWADSSDDQPTTSGLADSLLNDWALPLLLIGILMAASMIGAFTLFVMKEERICFGNLEVKKNDRSSMGFALSAILFIIGLAGAFTRKNAIIVLMCIELMLNAANMQFAAAAVHHGDPTGWVYNNLCNCYRCK